MSRACGELACITTNAEGEANGRFTTRSSSRRVSAAAGHLGQQVVELLVEGHVAGEGQVVQRGAAEHVVDGRQAGAGLRQHHGRRAALGGQPRREPLQGAPQLDGVGDVALGESAHGEAAPRQRLQQAFLFQPDQRRADGCARAHRASRRWPSSAMRAPLRNSPARIISRSRSCALTACDAPASAVSGSAGPGRRIFCSSSVYIQIERNSTLVCIATSILPMPSRYI